MIRMHLDATSRIDSHRVPRRFMKTRASAGKRRMSWANVAGYRNAQTTVLAPTGTIGFMMDCDTTGIEPDLALVKYKKLVGGGVIKIVNNTVPAALSSSATTRRRSTRSWITSIPAAPSKALRMLKPEHLSVFDCSFRPQNGVRSIHYMGHVRMMAAVQPFISGAISKTINMPEESTVEEIMDAYTESWKLGLKAVAIYRDNSKRVQPLSSGTAKGAKAATTAPAQVEERSRREDRLSPGPPQAARRARRHHAQVLDRRPRGLPHRRPVRRRHAGRAVHPHGEGRLDHFGPDG